MDGLPGYDAWKTQGPPEDERCEDCLHHDCGENCGCSECHGPEDDDGDAAYDAAKDEGLIGG